MDVIGKNMTIEEFIETFIEANKDADGIVPDLMGEFSFIRMITEGSQGKIGLLVHRKSRQKVVFKISVCPNFSIRHESDIMDKIAELHKYSPCFCKSYGMIKTYVSFDEENPFSESETKFLTDVLLIEYISSNKTASSIINKWSPHYGYSIMSQVLLSIEIGKIKMKLVHYDLHTDNILIKRCPEDAIFIYKIRDKIFKVKTYGIYPVIIDFGFAYVQNNSYLYSPMNQTDGGYLSCVYDPYYDTRIFVINSVSLLPKDSLLKQKIYALYNHLNIDLIRGWDKMSGFLSASDIISYTMADMDDVGEIDDEFITNNNKDCISILQSLIRLPLCNTGVANFRPYYKTFIAEFNKLEKTVTTDYNKMLILSQVVDSARKAIKCHYSIEVFKKDFFHYITKSLVFYNPPEDLDYHALLTSLINMNECFKTIYYRVLKDTVEKKKDDYRVKISGFDIYKIIEEGFVADMVFTEETPFYIYDMDEENTTTCIGESAMKEILD